jgi:hypothetical protein
MANDRKVYKEAIKPVLSTTKFKDTGQKFGIIHAIEGPKMDEINHSKQCTGNLSHRL